MRRGARTSLHRFVALSLGAVVALAGEASAQAPSDGQLLVLLRDASALAIVDPDSGNVLGQVPTGRDPHEVTASDDGRLAFVASMVDGISVIDIAAQEEIRRVDPGPGSLTHDVLFADDKLYFTIEGYKSIGRYDPAADAIDWTLGIGEDGSHMLVLDRERGAMFTPNIGSNTVTMVENVLEGPARARLTDIPVPGVRPEGIDLSPDGRELWTATRGDGGVSIIDGEAASLVVMDAATRSVIERVTVGETDTGDGAVLVGPEGRRAFLGLRAADRVAVVDLETLEITMEIPLGEGAGPGCLYWIGAS